MITQQMLDYIRQQTAAGKSQEEIKAALRQSGWQDADIEEGMRAFASGQNAAPSAPTQSLPKASQILKEAWEAYKERVGVYVGISLVPLLAIGIFGLIVGGGAVALRFSGISWHSPAMGGAGIVVVIIAILALIYLGSWGTVAGITAIKDRAENIGIKESFIRSRHLVLSFIGVSLLTGLAVMGGFILLIIPGIIFAIWFSQTSYVMVVEGITGTAALSKSKSYVQGRWGTVFGKLFFIGFITWLIFFIVSLPFGGIGSNGNHQNPIGALIIQILNLFWSPVVAIYGYMLYDYLKKSR